MMMDANGILQKQSAGGSHEMSKVTLGRPVPAMNVSSSHCYTSQSLHGAQRGNNGEV